MNRRDFLKRALGAVGMGLLMGSIEQVQEPDTLTIEVSDDSSVIAYDSWPSGWTHIAMTEGAIGEHTHPLPPYPSPFALSEDIVTIRDVLYRYRGRGG